MNSRKILNILFLLAFLTSLVGGNTSAVRAGAPLPGVKDKPEKPVRLTQADRDAAAARAAEAGFTLETAATANMAMAGDAPRYFSHPNYANSPLPSNVVADWNAIAQEILQPTPMPGMPMTMGGISMSAAFVYLAYTQAAIYDALVAIEGGYQPYAFVAVPDPTASREAAVATAAYTVLKHYLPLEPTLDGIYLDALAAIPDGAAKTAGITIGLEAANAIIALRLNDGVMDLTETYTVLPPGPGIWEPTMLPDGTIIPPVDPWMATLQPFLRATPELYRPVAPPALDDPAYVADLNEVRDYGWSCKRPTHRRADRGSQFLGDQYGHPDQRRLSPTCSDPQLEPARHGSLDGDGQYDRH